jgi:hypothetical protein
MDRESEVPGSASRSTSLPTAALDGSIPRRRRRRRRRMDQFSSTVQLWFSDGLTLRELRAAMNNAATPTNNSLLAEDVEHVRPVAAKPASSANRERDLDATPRRKGSARSVNNDGQPDASLQRKRKRLRKYNGSIANGDNGEADDDDIFSSLPSQPEQEKKPKPVPEQNGKVVHRTEDPADLAPDLAADDLDAQEEERRRKRRKLRRLRAAMTEAPTSPVPPEGANELEPPAGSLTAANGNSAMAHAHGSRKRSHFSDDDQVDRASPQEMCATDSAKPVPATVKPAESARSSFSLETGTTATLPDALSNQAKASIIAAPPIISDDPEIVILDDDDIVITASRKGTPPTFTHALLLNNHETRSDRPEQDDASIDTAATLPNRKSALTAAAAAECDLGHDDQLDDNHDMVAELSGSEQLLIKDGLPLFAHDPVLTSIEMEFAWLLEEDAFVRSGATTAPDEPATNGTDGGEDGKANGAARSNLSAFEFAYEYATPALQVVLRRVDFSMGEAVPTNAEAAIDPRLLAQVVRVSDWLVSRRFEQVRSMIRGLLVQGYRRPGMRLLLAEYRLLGLEKTIERRRRRNAELQRLPQDSVAAPSPPQGKPLAKLITKPSKSGLDRWKERQKSVQTLTLSASTLPSAPIPTHRTSKRADPRFIPVEQIDESSGEAIAEFATIKAASLATRISYSLLKKAFRASSDSQLFSAGGYSWRRKVPLGEPKDSV